MEEQFMQAYASMGIEDSGLMRKNGVCFCQNFLDDFSFEPFIITSANKHLNNL
jgi:hypothetical protein